MKFRTVTLPASGKQIKIRKPGPLTIEKALGYLPLHLDAVLEAGQNPEQAPSEETAAAAVKELQENLQFARKLICAVAVEPVITERYPAPEGELSLEELDFRDYWFLFLTTFRWSGMGQATELLRPTSATAGGSSVSTPSAAATEAPRAASSARS